jgi:hypothetical protein
VQDLIRLDDVNRVLAAELQEEVGVATRTQKRAQTTDEQLVGAHGSASRRQRAHAAEVAAELP